MTTASDETRLGILEGRLTEQSSALQDVRAALREVNARIDRMFLAILGIGAAQIGLLVTLIVRNG